jgi:ABC-type branched-subunit amino acid transport system substrate-binding protein
MIRGLRAKIELIVGDNQYTGAAAGEAARKLVERDGVFALQGRWARPHSAVYKYLEEDGIPTCSS